jgi:hypothetical protein
MYYISTSLNNKDIMSEWSVIPMVEPAITIHKLVIENGKEVFKPMTRLDFGDVAGNGDSDEVEFYLWNNFNGSKDIPNLQLGKLSVQVASPPVGSANNTEVVEEGWLSVREAYQPTAPWVKLGKDGTVDLEYALPRTLTGHWNDGQHGEPDYAQNYIAMVAKLSVPMNADVTMPYVFDIKVSGKFV